MGVKIAIGLPTNRGIKPKTAQSLMEMIALSKHEYHFIISTKGYNTAENRSYIVAQAIKNDCTHLLLTDDDMVYESDSLNKLLSHDKDIVGAKYSVRRIVEKGIQSEVIEYTDEKSDTELFKCGALGGGLLLIKTDVFRKIKRPWFGYEYYENGMVKMSNDWWFCRQATNARYDIWCDPLLEVGHIGEYEY